MPLQPGTKLGPYEIVSLIGAGGMGEVHRARDTRLDRTVAIKVLPAHLADKPELRERFEREARAVSSLNHPRICTLYDVGEQGGVYFLVMEYVDGETLADRIGRGPLSLDDSLKYAVEIADALDKAHRQGVVHRDLKPGNVMVTKAGTKLLDFGLAQLKRPDSAAGISSLSLPTNVTALTGQGVILGTLQYMAPEQLEGKDTDARTDIFAFGALVYEMATGRKAFEGKSQASLIAAILEREPRPISTLQPTSPPELDRLIRRCLAKDPDERWQTAADLCAELKWVAEPASKAEAAVEAVRKTPAKPKRGATMWMVIAVAFFLSTAALAVALLRATRPPAEPDVVQFAVAAPDKTAFAAGGLIGGTASASGSVSPDGRKLAFTAQDAGGRILLWIRSLDSTAARPLPGTDAATLPFWSPDSRWIGFFAQGKLKKIDIGGGSPQTVCDVPSGRGGTWNRDGVIVYAPNNPGPLFRVSASGGSPVQLTKLMPSQTNHRLPHFLPDGKHFLFFAARPTENSVFIGSLDSTDPRPLLAADSAAVYAPSGYLLFVRLGTLFAQSFDATALRLRGDPVPIADQVANDGLYRGFSVSENGVLTYRSGADAQNMQLAWFDRTGKLIDKIGTPGGYLGPNVSPDGKRIAVHRHDGAGGDIWMFEADRGVASPSRLTFDPGQDSSMPVWSPDGARIVFGALRHDKWGLYVKQADGTNEETILESDLPKMPMSWTSDGKFIVYWIADPQKGSDEWAVPMSGDRKPFPVLESPLNEQWPEVSPDGKWIAYTSDETGGREIYIKPFPNGAGKWQVSANGGMFSRWRGDGKELYYLNAPSLGKMMAVDIRETDSSIQLGVPHPLFDSGYVNLNHNTNYHTYAVARDGQRFLIRRPETVVTGDAGPSPITVVLNWPALLNRK